MDMIVTRTTTIRPMRPEDVEPAAELLRRGEFGEISKKILANAAASLEHYTGTTVNP